jgi:hypothetical protein
VKNASYRIKSSKSPTINGFDGITENSGQVKITSKAVASHAGYIRQFGIVSDMGVVPTKYEELLFSLEVDILISGLKSGTIIAIREASILTISRKAKSGTPTSNVEKMATPITTDKAHRPIFIYGQTSHYNWGPWIWVVVM